MHPINVRDSEEQIVLVERGWHTDRCLVEEGMETKRKGSRNATKSEEIENLQESV